MDYFSGTNPDLVSNKTIKQLEYKLVANNPSKHPQWTENCAGFYNNYIVPNMFPIIIFIIIALFLFIKYVLKKDRDEKENFDPSVPINRQRNRNRYVGDDNSIRRSGEQAAEDMPYEDIMDDYDENEYDENEYDENREHVTGLHNTWEGQEDTRIPNPYGYDNNYVMSTSDAVGFGTEMNKKSIDELAKMMFS